MAQAMFGVKLCKKTQGPTIYSTYTRPKLSQKNASKIDYIAPFLLNFVLSIARMFSPK